MHVLYVEDDPHDARLVERYLRSFSSDITITIAKDALAAEAALVTKPSLFLVDIMLGSARQGFEIIRSIRERGYNEQIIVITALTLPEDIEECFASGCTEVIAKPFNIGELDRVLSRYLSI